MLRLCSLTSFLLPLRSLFTFKLSTFDSFRFDSPSLALSNHSHQSIISLLRGRDWTLQCAHGAMLWNLSMSMQHPGIHCIVVLARFFFLFSLTHSPTHSLTYSLTHLLSHSHSLSPFPPSSVSTFLMLSFPLIFIPPFSLRTTSSLLSVVVCIFFCLQLHDDDDNDGFQIFPFLLSRLSFCPPFPSFLFFPLQPLLFRVLAFYLFFSSITVFFVCLAACLLCSLFHDLFSIIGRSVSLQEEEKSKAKGDGSKHDAAQPTLPPPLFYFIQFLVLHVQ